MIVHVPDLFPGRCISTRSRVHGDGHVETVRCLDYEHARHVCDFPDFTHVVIHASSLNSYTPRQPQPWIKPEAKGRTS